jgi:hypothetical protein
MPRGGARNRSGPGIDPNSARSDERGISLTTLPAEGFAGETPAFPLAPLESEVKTEREREVWLEAWTTPQAAAWATASWRWPIVAEYCRLKAMIELTPDVSASFVSQLHRYRDQLGLTPAGLKENGWRIAVDETAVKRTAAKKTARPSAKQRMSVVRNGSEG